MHDELFAELHKDHEEVKKIMEKLTRATPSAMKNREKQFMTLQEELIPHMKAEESTLYPALRDKKKSHMAALEALEEHHAAELILTELERLDMNDETWTAKAKVLQELLEHHIEEEESKIFDLTRSVIKEEQAEELLQQFREEKEDIKSTVA